MDGYGSPDALAGLAVGNTKNELLRQQLAQALSQMGRAPMQGYGLLGGIGAGLANAGTGIAAGLMARDARQGLTGNAAHLADARQQLAAAMMGGAASQSVPPQAPVGAPTPGPIDYSQPPPSIAGGPHPVDTSTPINEPGVADLAKLGVQRPQGGTTPAPAPQGYPGADALADISRKAQEDYQKGLQLLASGDPVLSQMGGALVHRAQAEQQMGFQAGQTQMGRDFEAQQNDLNRQNQRAVALKPEFRFNPLGTGAASFDPATGQVHQYPMGGPTGAAGADDARLIPYPVGSRPYKDIVDMGRQFEQSVDVAHLPANYQQDVGRLQLGQNLMGVIQQAKGSGWTKQLRQIAAADLQKLVAGSGGTEQEVNALSQKSIGTGIQDILSGLNGEPSGPELEKFSKFLTEFANREHGLAYDRLDQYVDSTANGGAGQTLRQAAPKYYEQAKRAAIQRLAALGEVKSPATSAESAAGLNLDAAPTHFLVSPDGKTRIAADANGNPLPGAQPEPINGR